MTNIVTNVLDTDKLKSVNALLKKSTFVDGRLTAGEMAAKVKQNEQVDGEDTLKALTRIIMPALIRHKGFLEKSFYCRINMPIFARYKKGMSYGPHVDDPMMNSSHGPFRTDLAMTLWLNEPHEYEGGELYVGDTSYKLQAGTMVLYPANTRHSVAPVTKGERLVMVNWCQSMVKSNEQRELLHLLQSTKNYPTAEEVHEVYSKLVRMWVDV